MLSVELLSTSALSERRRLLSTLGLRVDVLLAEMTDVATGAPDEGIQTRVSGNEERTKWPVSLAKIGLSLTLRLKSGGIVDVGDDGLLRCAGDVDRGDCDSDDDSDNEAVDGLWILLREHSPMWEGGFTSTDELRAMLMHTLRLMISSTSALSFAIRSSSNVNVSGIRLPCFDGSKRLTNPRINECRSPW